MLGRMLLGAVLCLIVCSSPSFGAARVRVGADASTLEALGRAEAAARALPETAAILRDALLLSIQNLRVLLDNGFVQFDRQQAQIVADIERLATRADVSVEAAFREADQLQQSIFNNVHRVTGVTPHPVVRRFAPLVFFPNEPGADLRVRGLNFDRVRLSLLLDGQEMQIIPTTSTVIVRQITRSISDNQRNWRVPVELRADTMPWFPWNVERFRYESSAYLLPPELGRIVGTRSIEFDAEESWIGRRHDFAPELAGRELRYGWECEELPAGRRVKEGSLSFRRLPLEERCNNSNRAEVRVRTEFSRSTNRNHVCVYMYHSGARDPNTTRTQNCGRITATLVFRDTRQEQLPDRPLFWGRDEIIRIERNDVIAIEAFDGSRTVLSDGLERSSLWFTHDRRPADSTVIVRPYGPNRPPPWAQ